MGLSNAWNVATTSLATNAGLTSIVSRNISNAQNSTGVCFGEGRQSGHRIERRGDNPVDQRPGQCDPVQFDAVEHGGQLFGAVAFERRHSIAADGQRRDDDDDPTTAAQSPSTLIQSLSSALQTYSSSPGSSSAASAVLTAAQNLASGLNAASATVANVRETADQDMVNSVATINSLLAQFQDVNTAIVKGTATGADISDALDQRDTILQSLSRQIGVTTTTNGNGSMSIYTDSGATLFDTTPRSVTMSPTTTYTASTVGAAVYVDGVPVTGANAVMPIQSGALAGLANLRDTVATQYQAQLDSIAGGLVNAFAETNTTTGGQLPGLFTSSGATSIPGATLISGPGRRHLSFSAPSIQPRAAASISSATAGSTARPMCKTALAPRATTASSRRIFPLWARRPSFLPAPAFRPPPAFPITRRIRPAGSMANINRPAMTRPISPRS